MTVEPVVQKAISGNVQYRNSTSFRALKALTVGAIFKLCDEGKEGDFRVKKAGAKDVQPVDDGAMTLVANNGYYAERILEDDVVCLNWFGLRTGAEFADQNTRITADALKGLNYCTLKVRKTPGTDNTYHWNHLPGSGIFNNQEEACISFEDKVMVFEFELGVKGSTESGYAALQTFPRNGVAYLVQKRVSFSQKGGPDKYEGAQPDGKGGYLVDEEGQLVYNQDWGSYKKPGLRQWSYGELHGVNYYGYSGPGVCVFGQIGVRAPRVYRDFTALVGYWNGDLYLHPTTAELFADMAFADTIVEIEGREQTLRVDRASEDQSLCMSYGSPESTGLKPGAEVRGRYARKTQDFFADFVQAYPLDGLCNFDGNRGPGFFVVGAEANHGNFQAVSCRDNYGPGYVDWSFLGSKTWARHCTTNGKGFKKNGRTTMGGYMIGWNPSSASTDVAPYDEDGQGPNQLWGNATILGGFNPNSVVGGGGVLQNNRLQGFAQLGDGGRVEGKASLVQSRMAAVADELATTPTLAEARAAYVARNLMQLPMAA